MKLSKYVVVFPKNKDTSLIYSSLSNAIFEIPNSSVDSNGKIDRVTLDDLILLNKMKIIAEDDEKQQMIELLESRKKTDTQLSLWVYLTSTCNLNCGYCYEKHELSKSYGSSSEMSFETMEKLVSWCIRYIKNNQTDNISITLTGGEPLLHSKGLNYLIHLLTDANLLSICKFTLITNGYLLTDDMLQFIVNYVDAVQITIDGPGKIHDIRRPTTKQEPTFKSIIRNVIRIISKKKINMIIRINVDLKNMNYIEQLIPILDKYQIKRYVSINLGDVIDETNTNPFVLKGILSIYDSFIQNGYDAVICETTPCPISNSGWFAIAPNGDIFKCTGMIGNRQYSVGNVSFDELNEEYDHQINLDSWHECIDCEVVGICAGGCSYRSLLTGNSEKRICRKGYLLEVLKRQVQASANREDEHESN